MRTATDIIEEVRHSRQELSAECGHDRVRYVKLMQKLGGKYTVQTRRYEQRTGRQHAAPVA